MAFAKRALDLVGAGAGLVALAPVISAAAVAVYVSMGRPIFFRQVRPGYKAKPFTLVKFRTMKTGEGSDADRLTNVGEFLRATSIDELPQLWNVLKGEMSIVGVRPLLMEYLPLYSKRHARRHEVKPGLTSWCGVNGRNTVTWEEQFEMDVWYVENESLLLDLKIIAMTIGKVLRREGISQEGHATREKFRGLGIETRPS